MLACDKGASSGGVRHCPGLIFYLDQSERSVIFNLRTLPEHSLNTKLLLWSPLSLSVFFLYHELPFPPGILASVSNTSPKCFSLTGTLRPRRINAAHPPKLLLPSLTRHLLLEQLLGCWSVSLHLFFFFSFIFSRLHPWHMELPRLGVELEWQLLASTTAAAMQNMSLVCELHHSSWQRRILNPLSEAGD